jgi:flagellar basal-body rod modification protein FlgD
MTTINTASQTAAQTAAKTTSTTTKTSSSSTSDTTATTKTASNKLSQDYTTFLKLLTTQLQNQDPMSPMDSSQFTNQLVQYSQVEQQIGQNDKLEKLVKMQSNNQTQASLGFIGLDVEATGSAFSYDGSSPAKMSYTLPETPASTTLQIKNDKGTVIRTIEGVRSTSRQEFTWDGKKSDGTTAAAGNYSLSVVAPNAAGKMLTATTSVFGRISGIESGNGNTTLMMGNTSIQMENVISAHPPATTAAAA